MSHNFRLLPWHESSYSSFILNLVIGARVSEAIASVPLASCFATRYRVLFGAMRSPLHVHRLEANKWKHTDYLASLKMFQCPCVRRTLVS